MCNNQFLSPHFKLAEFVVSQTAEKHGIVNVPSELEVENLRRLCENCLEPLREALGLPEALRELSGAAARGAGAAGGHYQWFPYQGAQCQTGALFKYFSTHERTGLRLLCRQG